MECISYSFTHVERTASKLFTLFKLFKYISLLIIYLPIILRLSEWDVVNIWYQRHWNMLLSVIISLQKVLNTTLLKMFSKHLSECYIITLCAVLRKHGWGINSSLSWECSLQCYWNTSFLTVYCCKNGDAIP